jgi:hypothetical protein
MHFAATGHHQLLAGLCVTEGLSRSGHGSASRKQGPALQDREDGARLVRELCPTGGGVIMRGGSAGKNAEETNDESI